jgi:hypothetical protein
MISFRNQLLQTFGIERDYAAIVNSDIQLQHSDDPEPFAEILTDKTGRTTLRVGRLQQNKVPVIKIR